MKTIPLTQGKFALVDDEDVAILMRYKWHAAKGNGTFYAITNVKNAQGKYTSLKMHTVIMRFHCGPSNGLEVDHWNHDGLEAV